MTAAVLLVSGCTGSLPAGSPGQAPSSAAGAAATPAKPSASPASPARHKTPSGPSAAFPLKVVHDPGQVTGSLTGHCHARGNGRLPDRRCTPGAIDPAVTQGTIWSTICRSGYTENVRPPESQTESFKFGQAYPAYGIPSGTAAELDHLVPLELGGANDAANLWPEAGPIPNPKDSVEDTLNHAVCDGRIGLARAQRAIASNWETAESRLGLGGSVPAPAPSSQPAPSSSSQPAGALRCTVSVSDRSPADYTTVYVRVSTAAGASVTAVAHYKTTDNQKTTSADGSGQATVAYYISGATPGYTVAVDVTASAGGHTARCSASFTPAR